MELEYGATYSHVNHADPQSSMPGLDPMIYVGDNLGDKGETIHSFQGTVSVKRFGLAEKAAGVIILSSDRDTPNFRFWPTRAGRAWQIQRFDRPLWRNGLRFVIDLS